jgi:isoleucyl-tRNA synthetase
MNINLFPEDNTYSAHEHTIMQKWSQEDTYKKTLEKNKDGPQFMFMDGPPFVSSNCLHFGHLMIGFLKSTVLNYHQMKGYNCLNELGYDCHGLPIEMVANKKLGIYTKKEVEDFGIDKYNAACKDMIHKFSGAWTPIYQRIGRWANFDKTYKTTDTNFMESVWWVFAQMFKKNLVYKGHQVMPYSNVCNSPLSNFEAGQNYKDIETRSIYVLFKLKDYENTFIVAWTTTPWSLPGNLALCVNHEGIYDWIESKDKVYICAKNLTKNLDIKDGKVIKSTNASEIIGLEYEPLFSYMNEFPSDKKFKIIKDTKNNYVSLANSTTGTGIVHIAPFYGEDDYRVCTQNGIIDNTNIDKACTIDDNGKFLNIIKEFESRIVTDKDTNDEIIKNLKIKGLMLRTQVYTHSYPFCYRTDTPLIYKVTSSYFIKVPELREDLLNNNEKVNWYPSNIGSGRFKQWLDNVKDWGVSRNRFFGTPIPIWVSDDGEEVVCISSIDELVELAQLPERLTDLHRETIDSIEIPSKMGKGTLKNIKLVFDCWFESGCVPIAQLHYPFENSNAFDNCDYLSEFIAEGIDQTRGWFYTLMVVSTAIFNKPAFKNVICTGLILDENGLKFSKKYGNFKDPMDILNKYGADVVRLYLLNSPTINADPLLFSETSIEKVKQKLIPYINAVKLFLTQVKDYHNKGNTLDTLLWKNTDNIMDKWIISNTWDLVYQVTKLMELYKIDKIITLLVNFIEDLTNWYIKLNRDRIRGLINNDERAMSLSVLYKVLITYIRTMAPFTPFLSEHLYEHLKFFEPEILESVHYTNYPTLSELFIDNESVIKFNILKDVIKNIRNLRNTLTTHTSMKIPIYKAIIFHNNHEFIESVKFFEEVIKEEVNCLEIEYDNLANNLVYKLVPNHKSIGKKFRIDATYVKNALQDMNCELVAKIYKENCKTFTIEGIGKDYEINSEDYTIELVPASQYSSNPDMINKIDNELMIAIDKRYTEELHNVFQIRKLGTFTQRLRRSTNLNPWNKILVNYSGSPKFENIFTLMITEMKTRLLCEVSVNTDNTLDIYAESTYEYEFFDESIENINFKIYLL